MYIYIYMNISLAIPPVGASELQGFRSFRTHLGPINFPTNSAWAKFLSQIPVQNRVLSIFLSESLSQLEFGSNSYPKSFPNSNLVKILDQNHIQNGIRSKFLTGLVSKIEFDRSSGPKSCPQLTLLQILDRNLVQNWILSKLLTEILTKNDFWLTIENLSEILDQTSWQNPSQKCENSDPAHANFILRIPFLLYAFLSLLSDRFGLVYIYIYRYIYIHINIYIPWYMYIYIYTTVSMQNRF